jgi:hypothetical protein
MIRLLITLLGLPTALALSGCTSLGQLARDRQNIPFKAYPDPGQAAIYLWPPYTSAAIVDPQNNRCVLTASGAQTVEASAEAAIKAGDVFGKIANLDASTKSTLIEAFKQISAADNRATALDIALFHLCMLDQNGTFKHMEEGGKGREVMAAYKLTVETALKMPK